MQCDMCGKNVFSLKPSLVEGVQLSVCSNCMRYGKPVPKKEQKKFISPSKKREIVRRVFNIKELESKESIIKNYAQAIKNARRKLGLEQKALAVTIAEKDSVIQAIETGKKEPSIALAKKLEKKLKIKLIEELKESSDDESTEILKQFKKKPNRQGKLTLGDIITIKKRK